MTSSAVTQEQLNAGTELLNLYVQEYGVTGNKDVQLAIKTMQILHGNPSVNYDDNRTKRVNMQKTTGTVSIVGTDGIPTSTDFGASRVPHEELYTMKQYMGVHSLIERNLAQLNGWYQSIVVTKEGIRNASQSLRMEGIGDIFVKEIAAAMFSHIIGRMEAFLNAVTTDTIYSDYIASNAASVIETKNIITGGFDLTTPASLISKAVAAVDYNGNKLDLIMPKIIFADAGTSYTKVLEIMNPGQTINMTHKQVLDLFNNEVLVVPFVSTAVDIGVSDDWPTGKTQSGVAGDCHVFTGELPFKLMSETMEPRIRPMNLDKYYNGGILVDFTYAWIWTSRNGYFYVQGA